MINLYVCPSCGCEHLTYWMEVDRTYKLVRCTECDLGFIEPTSGVGELVDYSDYGDHITAQNNAYFASRMRVSFKKNIFFKIIKLFINPINAKILDFGGGAGFFAKSCINSGFPETYLVEPSINFRSAAIQRVGLDESKVFSKIDDVPNINFDLIVMLDVIEHLPESAINQILENVFKRTCLGGYFLGFTPNACSLNIKLHGEKDPAIDPPRHVFYFNKKSIDYLLGKHGFTKIISFTFGFKVNSFFREKKHTPSWVEKPTVVKRPLATLIKFGFKLLSAPVSLFGGGYHVFFLYKREALKS